MTVLSDPEIKKRRRENERKRIENGGLMSEQSMRKKAILWGVFAFLLCGVFGNALVTEYWAVWELDNDRAAGVELLKARDRYGLWTSVERRAHGVDGEISDRDVARSAVPVFRASQLFARTRGSLAAALGVALGSLVFAVLPGGRAKFARATPTLVVPLYFVPAAAVVYSAWRWESHFHDRWKRRLAKSGGLGAESDVRSATCDWGCGMAVAGAGILLIMGAGLLRIAAAARVHERRERRKAAAAAARGAAPSASRVV